MNIFCTSPCPVQSAKWLCDKHVVKQGLESCQILANCFTLAQLAHPLCPRTQTGTARGHFNPKHPSCKFAVESRGNMQWLIDHTEAIFQEKYRRYPTKGRHFAHDFLDWVKANFNNSIVPDGPFTNFTIAISQDKFCRMQPGFNYLDIHHQYQSYIIYDKPFAKWPTIDDIPPWYPDKTKYVGYVRDFNDFDDDLFIE